MMIRPGDDPARVVVLGSELVEPFFDSGYTMGRHVEAPRRFRSHRRHVRRARFRSRVEQLLSRFPDFAVDAPAGRFAPGAFVRRYEYLPISTGA